MAFSPLSSASRSDDADDEPYEFRPSSSSTISATEPFLSVTNSAESRNDGVGNYYSYKQVTALDECPDDKCLTLMLDESFLFDDSSGEIDKAQTRRGNTAGVGVAGGTHSSYTLQSPQSQLSPQTILLYQQQKIMQEYIRQVSQLHTQQIYLQQQQQQMMMLQQQQQQQLNMQLLKQQCCDKGKHHKNRHLDQQQQQEQQHQQQQQMVFHQQQLLLFHQHQHSALRVMHNNLLFPHQMGSDKNNARAHQDHWLKLPGKPHVNNFDYDSHRINPSPVLSSASKQGQHESKALMLHNVPASFPLLTQSTLAASTTDNGSTDACNSGYSNVVSITSSFAEEKIKCDASNHHRDDDIVASSHVVSTKRDCQNSDGRVHDDTGRDAKRRNVEPMPQAQQESANTIPRCQLDLGADKEEGLVPMTKKKQEQGQGDTQHLSPSSSVDIKCSLSNSGNNFSYVQVVGGGALKCPLSSKNDNDCRSMNSCSISSKDGAAATSFSSKTLPWQKAVTASTSRLQDYLDTLLSSRGYRPKKVGAIELGYRPHPPTPLQLASFGYAVCSITTKAALRSNKNKYCEGEAARLSALLRAGLSPNPTNKFGESPFFVACKHGSYPLVEAFVDAGAEVRIADGFGRSPLHFAAWADPPSMKSIRLLLERRRKSIDTGADNEMDGDYDYARLLYVSDVHGKTALDYVGDIHHGTWIEFLEGVKDEFWPVQEHGNGIGAGVEYCPRPRWKSRGDAENVGSFPAVDCDNDIPDPKDALSLDLAEKVANGHMMPQEARRQQQQQPAESA